MRFAEPRYQSWRAAELPSIGTAVACVRVLAGTISGKAGPIGFSLPAVFAHRHLEPGAIIDVAVDADLQLGLFVLHVAARDANGTTVWHAEFARLSTGDTIALENPAQNVADIILLGGSPAELTILFSGPFVMSTPEEIDMVRD